MNNFSKKMSICLRLFLLCLLLTGCVSEEKSSKAENETADKMKAAQIDDIGEEKRVSGVGIRIVKAVELEHPEEKGKQVLQLKLEATNYAAKERAVDVFEMTVWNHKNKKMSYYPSDNLGAILAPGESIEGNGYFVIEGEGPFKVEYVNTDTKEKQIWQIENVENTANQSKKK